MIFFFIPGFYGPVDRQAEKYLANPGKKNHGLLFATVTNKEAKRPDAFNFVAQVLIHSVYLCPIM